MSIETDSPVVYHGTSESRFPKKEIQAQITTELTAEEKEILRQCNKESLYYRCLPLALAGMTATFLAVKKGFITPNPVWGPTISMSAAAFVGWVVGKVSYKSKCEDKFLHLENSIIGEAIRRKRGYSLDRYQNEFSKTQTSGDDLTLRDDPSFSYYSDSDYHPSTGSLNLDVDKNIQYSGLDDRERPSTDRDTMQLVEENEPVKKFTTYDELRLRNREEYERLQRPYSRADLAPPDGQKPWNNIDNMPPRRYNSDFRDSISGETRRKDGDTWDNTKLL